jgi:Gluconate 2-dehydrogenase subunit 3
MKTHAEVVSRRRFFALSAGGAVVVAAAGGALRWFAFGYSKLLGPGDHPIALSVKEMAIAKAIVETLLPGEDGFPSGVSLAVHQRIDEETWAAGEGLQSDLKDGLALLEHATLAYGFGSRFTSLSRDAREAYFDKLLRGSNETLRLVASGLRQMTYLLYYAQPEVWPHIGYPGPMVEKAVPPDSHVAYVELVRRKGGGA